MIDVKTVIMQKLRETETIHNVKIPLAVESGSRGWGFSSPDSDYDCRFIYVHDRDWYLSVFDKRDVIEYAADEIFDINGWDLKKVLNHIAKSNAVMMEWLSSNEIYVKNDSIAGRLLNLAADYFNPITVCHHYLSMAKGNLSKILSGDDPKLKTYFYVLRPLANVGFIREHKKIPYMEYERTLAEISVENEVLTVIHELLQIKKLSAESYKIKKNGLLIKFFEREITSFEQFIAGMKFEKNRNYEAVDAVFRNIMAEVMA